METREVQDKRRTASFAASAEGTKVVFSENYKYYHFRNDGGGTVYVSAYSDVGEGVDGTKSIADGGCGYVFSCDDHVFVKGAAKVTVEASNLPECPFKSAQRGGDITAKGNPVQIDGLQGGVPFSEIAVSGKNLLKYPYYNTTKTISGITFTDNGDGTITANGTATATASYFLDSEFNYIGGITYTISGCPKGGSNSTYKIKGDRLGAYIDDNGNGATYSFKYDTTADIVILIYKDTTVDNIVFRPQLEYGDTATEYEPPITGRELTVGVSGKNLLRYPFLNTTKTENGITFTDNGDGSITVNGTATATTYFSLSSNKALSTGKYVLSKSMDNIFLYVDKYLDNAFYQRVATSTVTVKELIFNVSEEDARKYTYKFGIQFNKGNIADNVTIYPQLELGDTATAYEPYHGSTTTITPDSNPYIVPNDIRQQDGLNNISVSAGTLSVTGVRKNAAIKRIWDEIDEIKTAIIVSNGESE